MSCQAAVTAGYHVSAAGTNRIPWQRYVGGSGPCMTAINKNTDCMAGSHSRIQIIDITATFMGRNAGRVDWAWVKAPCTDNMKYRTKLHMTLKGMNYAR